MSGISRRDLLKSGSVATAAMAIGFGGMFGTRALAADEVWDEAIGDTDTRNPRTRGG